MHLICYIVQIEKRFIDSHSPPQPPTPLSNFFPNKASINGILFLVSHLNNEGVVTFYACFSKTNGFLLYGVGSRIM